MIVGSQYHDNIDICDSCRHPPMYKGQHALQLEMQDQRLLVALHKELSPTPSPSPTLRCWQSVKSGHTWYIISCEYDIFDLQQNFSQWKGNSLYIVQPTTHSAFGLYDGYRLLATDMCQSFPCTFHSLVSLLRALGCLHTIKLFLLSFPMPLM